MKCHAAKLIERTVSSCSAKAVEVMTSLYWYSDLNTIPCNVNSCILIFGMNMYL